MMQTIFRIILVIVSFMTVAFMMRRIRQAKVQIEAALFWVVLSAILFVFAVFPPLADLCASLDEDEDALRQTLAGVDYHYDPVHNQFI